MLAYLLADRISWLPGCPRTHDVTKTGLDLLILLPQPPQCWDYVCTFHIFTSSELVCPLTRFMKGKFVQSSQTYCLKDMLILTTPMKSGFEISKFARQAKNNEYTQSIPEKSHTTDDFRLSLQNPKCVQNYPHV